VSDQHVISKYDHHPAVVLFGAFFFVVVVIVVVVAGNPFHIDRDAQIGRTCNAAQGSDANQQTFSPLMFAVNTEPATLGT
jgi:hypothetical protein